MPRPNRNLPPFPANLDEKGKRELLSRNAAQHFRDDRKLIEKTQTAQNGNLDRMMLACYKALRLNVQYGELLTDEERYQHGINPFGINEEENQLSQRLTKDAISSIIKTPAPEELRTYLYLYGLLQAKCTHEIGKQNADYLKKAEEIINKHIAEKGPIPEGAANKEVNGRSLQEQLGDYLTTMTWSTASQISQTANLELYRGLNNHYISGSSDDNGLSYLQALRPLLGQQFMEMLEPPENPTMTVDQFIRLVNMDQKAADAFLKKTNLDRGGNFFAQMRGRLEKKMPQSLNRVFAQVSKGRKQTAKLQEELNKLEPGSADYKTKNTALLQEQSKLAQAENEFNTGMTEFTFTVMKEMYVEHAMSGWIREGEQAYEQGLQGTERKEFQNGKRILEQESNGKLAIEGNLRDAGLDPVEITKPLSRENALKSLQESDDVLLSGEPLRMAHREGISEAVYASNPSAFDNLAAVTEGALINLSRIPSTWKGHKVDSKKYTNALEALKNYHEALVRREGGQILDCRKRFLRATAEYLRGKESTRSNEHGQGRFDTFVAVLQKELTKDGYAHLIEKINRSRYGRDKITVDSFEAKANGLAKVARKNQKAQLDSCLEHATKLSAGAAARVFELDQSCKFEGVRDRENLPFSSVGHRDYSKTHYLSERDYHAVTFACALCSRQRENLAGGDVLAPGKAALQDGKQTADALFRAYSGKNSQGKSVPIDKIPLAKALTVGIQTLNREMAGKAAQDKECLKEMSARLAHMLERDPELMKFAERQGLKPEELPTVQKQPVEAVNREKDLQGDGLNLG